MKKKRFKRLSRKFEKVENFLNRDELIDNSRIDHTSYNETEDEKSRLKIDLLKQDILSAFDCVAGNVECEIRAMSFKDLGFDKLSFEVEVAKILNREISKLEISHHIHSASFSITAEKSITHSIELNLLGEVNFVHDFLQAVIPKLNRGLSERFGKSKFYLVESLNEEAKKLVFIYEYDKDYRIKYLKQLKAQRIEEEKSSKKVIRNFVKDRDVMAKTEVVLSVKVNSSENQRKKKIIKPSRKSRSVNRDANRTLEM